VLIYLDLGMEPRLQLAAALWLAPVQCNGMGHPITSGLPSITHVLTSALMEPPDGDAHYTETPVRLPGTSLCYRLAPIDRLIDASPPLTRENDRVRFLCAQNLQKYLPAFDHVFADIAAGAAGAEFHFISDQSSHATERFRARIAQAFATRNLSAEDFCRFHPRLDNQAYMSLNLGCDVFLDSPMWSGNNTTHEAVACGLPVITWPGPMMRGRHAAAICAMMGISETVARDIEEYVALGVRAANDAAWRGHLRDEIATRRERLFDDPRPVRALESFLLDGTTEFDHEH